MDVQLKLQLKQTILVANSTAVNDAGEPQYGASSSYLGREIGKSVFVRNSKGEEVLSSKQIIFPSSVDVRINSRIYLSGETTSANDGWVPVAIGMRFGEASSSDHWKVWLGGDGFGR